MEKERSFEDEDDDEGERSGIYSIDVAVRVRPMNGMEVNENNTVRVMDERMIVILDPAKIEGAHEEGYLRANRSRERRYAFDHAFDENASQEAVYQATTQKLLDGVMDGFNASCFAYGATGAGKTYTMLGTEASPGCMVLTVGELFERIKADDSKVYRVYLTYLEVYNENIRDLLNPTSGYLDLREDPVKGICVAGITECSTSTVGETMELLHRGNLNRSVEPTKKNETSSRSHAIMQIMVEGKDRTVDMQESVRIGKLSLIDLAGSERASATDNRGARLVEGANINRSLLALANCINALASESEAMVKAGRNGRRRPSKNFVPYRDSKLTRLLKDSFGGNCRTVMITNISPAGNQYEETINSLKYANRAKDIKTKVVQNVVEMDHHVVQYQNIIRELRMEVLELRSQVSNAQLAGQPPRTILPSIAQRPSVDGAVGRRGSYDGAVRGSLEGARRDSVEYGGDGAELAARAKQVFRERAKMLRRLIDIEESVYSLKIDLAVKGLARRRGQADGGGGERAAELEQLEAELQGKIRDKEQVAVVLLSRLQENEQQGKDVQLAMKRRVKDKGQLELLAMLVKNHILEIQNIELQLRDRAKEQLRDRVLEEVGRDVEVSGFLPKIEIAKQPLSPERQLFTPSSKAPGAGRLAGLGNGCEITRNNAFQMGSRLGSITVDLDEDFGIDRSRSAPASPASPRTSNRPPSSAIGEEGELGLEVHMRAEAVGAAEAMAMAEPKATVEVEGVGAHAIVVHGQGDPHREQQMDRYRERLQLRQEMLRRQRDHQEKERQALHGGHDPSNLKGGGGPAKRRATPERQQPAHAPRGGRKSPEPEAGGGGWGGGGGLEVNARPLATPEKGAGGHGKGAGAGGKGAGGGRGSPTQEREVRRRKSSLERRGSVEKESGRGLHVQVGSGGRGGGGGGGGGVGGDGLESPGLNLERTEVRNVMRPLQADSQIERFAELQERYNLGKQNAAQKRRARSKLMKLQAKHANGATPDHASPSLDAANPYDKPRHAAPRRRPDQGGGPGEGNNKNPFVLGDNMVIANGFSHNQKLSKENPFAERGSGLNHNQNLAAGLNIGGAPRPQPREAARDNPYLAEAHRVRGRGPGNGH